MDHLCTSSLEAGRVVIVVEDDEDLLSAISDNISHFGYKVLEATNATDAMSILAAQRADLLLTNAILPGSRNGWELAQEALRQQPDLAVLLMTDRPVEATRISLGIPDRLAVLAKPFGGDELHKILADLLNLQGRNGAP